MCHAELNAICNKYAQSLNGCTIYTTLFPCNECAKLIIQSGIVKVIYLQDTKFRKTGYKASRFMLKKAEVELE